MSHTTQQQPTTAQTAAALVAMTGGLARRAQHCAKHDTTRNFPTLTTDPHTNRPMLYVAPDTLDEAATIAAGMTGPVVFREIAHEHYRTQTWRGDLVEGWRVAVVWTEWDTAHGGAVRSDESIGRPENIGTHPDAVEHQDDDAAQLATSGDRLAAAWLATVDTSPATAAAELPAGPVDTWPAVVPAQRPPAELLPSPSWARVGMTTAFPAEPVGLVRPLTDPALIGHDPTAPQDDEQPAGKLVDLADVRAARVAAAADEVSA